MAGKTDDKNFEQDVLKSDLPVLVDFWAEWCGPCKQLSPVLDALEADNQGKLKILKVNIEDSPEAPTTYGVRGIPNLILFKDGKVVDQKVGALPQSALQTWLDSKLS